MGKNRASSAGNEYLSRLCTAVKGLRDLSLVLFSQACPYLKLVLHVLRDKRISFEVTTSPHCPFPLTTQALYKAFCGGYFM